MRKYDIRLVIDFIRNRRKKNRSKQTIIIQYEIILITRQIFFAILEISFVSQQKNISVIKKKSKRSRIKFSVILKNTIEFQIQLS